MFSLLMHEVRLHASCRYAVHMSEAGITETAVACWFRVILDLDVAVVDVSAAEGVMDLRLALDLPELVGRSQGADGLLDVVDVAWTPEQVRIRRKSPRWIQAVSVPPQATRRARENRAIVSGGLLAGVAQNRVVVLVDNLVKVKLLLVNGLLLPVITCQLTWRKTGRGTQEENGLRARTRLHAVDITQNTDRPGMGSGVECK